MNSILPEKLVFVVGAPRSGTTWTQLMLAQHPDVATCQETHLFSGYLHSYFASSRQHLKKQRPVGLSNVLGYDHCMKLCREFSGKIIADLVGDDHNPRIFLEKTPDQIDCFDFILEIFPDAYFIEVVRDPRAMVASMRAVDWGRWADKGVIENTEIWRAAILNGMALENATERHMRVRYEDMLSDPGGQLSAMLAFLGEDIPADGLEEWVENTSMDNLRKRDNSGGMPWDLGTEPHNFYRKGEAESWRDELTGPQIATIEGRLGRLMGDRGYAHSTGLMKGICGAGLRNVAYRCCKGVAWRGEKYARKL